MIRAALRSVSAILTDPACQHRVVPLGDAYADQLANVIRDGGRYTNAPIVFEESDGGLWLGDGHYRRRGAELAGAATLPVEVRPGGKRAAFLYSLSANCDHGKKREPEDLRAAIVAALSDPERPKSLKDVAKLVRCSDTWVGKVDRELSGRAPDPKKSAAALARNGLGPGANSLHKSSTAVKPYRPAGRTPAAPSGIKDRMGRDVPARVVEGFDPANAGEGGPLVVICPACDADQDEHDCPTCGGLGGLNEAQYAALAPVLRESAEFQAREEAASAASAPTWRDRPAEQALKVNPTVLGKLHAAGVHTCGQLADRLDRRETFALIPDVVADLRESLGHVAAGEWPRCDGLGRPIPWNQGRLRDSILGGAPQLAEKAEQLKRIAADLRTASSWAPWLKPTTWDAIERAAAEVDGARPFAVCPGCGGAECEACLTSGHLPAWMEHELRAAAKKKQTA